MTDSPLWQHPRSFTSVAVDIETWLGGDGLYRWRVIGPDWLAIRPVAPWAKFPDGIILVDDDSSIYGGGATTKWRWAAERRARRAARRHVRRWRRIRDNDKRQTTLEIRL